MLKNKALLGRLRTLVHLPLKAKHVGRLYHCAEQRPHPLSSLMMTPRA